MEHQLHPNQSRAGRGRRLQRRPHASAPERAGIEALVALGLRSDAVPDRVEAVRIDRVIRGAERPSDHAPLVIDLPV